MQPASTLCKHAPNTPGEAGSKWPTTRKKPPELAPSCPRGLSFFQPLGEERPAKGRADGWVDGRRETPLDWRGLAQKGGVPSLEKVEGFGCCVDITGVLARSLSQRDPRRDKGRPPLEHDVAAKAMRGHACALTYGHARALTYGHARAHVCARTGSASGSLGVSRSGRRGELSEGEAVAYLMPRSFLRTRQSSARAFPSAASGPDWDACAESTRAWSPCRQPQTPLPPRIQPTSALLAESVPNVGTFGQ